jgi:2,4-dienoyl-CoA reductase-like NADH-dependent reductase (Old Yellow Enzyme family)
MYIRIGSTIPVLRWAVLYEPLTFRSGAVMPNRIALAAMTNGQSLADGRLGEDELAWLGRRADGGFGLISTCAAHVMPEGKAWEGQLGIDRDDQLPGLSRLADRIRRTGALASVQLFHGGLRALGYDATRVITPADLTRVIDCFAAAAVRAERAGFDGVELHAAHGYLLSQFLSATMNPLGGSLADRARLVREVMRTVRSRVGASFVVGVRLSLEDWGSARGLDLDESLEVAAQLVDDGADYIHASLWDAAAMTKKRPTEHALPLLRAALPRSIAIFAAGSIWTAADAHAVLERGASVIALGRAAILHPDWPRRARAPGWEPMRPPITRAELLDRSVSPVFAHYLTRWKGFVSA